MSVQEYIGTAQDSRLVDDIEALTAILPTLVLAKIDATDADAPKLSAAIEAVAYTIDNLSDVRLEVFG